MQTLDTILNAIWGLMPFGMLAVVCLTYREVRKLRKKLDDKETN